jgi:hypothetical protein
MQISSTGKNLSICIGCDYSSHSDWMAFLCWYSIQKNLPDSKISISCLRTPSNYDHFHWVKRCKTTLNITKKTNWEDRIKSCDTKNKILYVSSDYVCISGIDELPEIQALFANKEIFNGDEEEFCGDCKEDKNYLFATYKNGWGNFVLSKWINNNNSPLLLGTQFKSGLMTVNEMRVGNLWDSASKLFREVR